MNMFPNHVMLLRLFAYFLNDVMNNEHEAHEIILSMKSYEDN